MENINSTSAPIRARFIAFLMDSFFVYFFRFVYINLSLKFWLFEYILDFGKKYKLLFGKFDFSSMTSVELQFFLKSDLFKQLWYFVIGIFLISVIYNLLLLSTKWSATIGQRIMGLIVVKSNNEKINFFHKLFRSVLVVLPWFFVSTLFFYKILSEFGFAASIDKVTFVVGILIFVSWYDLIFITKNKVVFHDYLSFTRVIVRDERYEKTNKLIKFLFPDFRNTYSKLKDITKRRFEKLKEIKENYKKEKEKIKNKK